MHLCSAQSYSAAKVLLVTGTEISSFVICSRLATMTGWFSGSRKYELDFLLFKEFRYSYNMTSNIAALDIRRRSAVFYCCIIDVSSVYGNRLYIRLCEQWIMIFYILLVGYAY